MFNRLELELPVDASRYSEALLKCNARSDRGFHSLVCTMDRIINEMGGNKTSTSYRGISKQSFDNAIKGKNKPDPRAYVLLEALREISGIDTTVDQSLHRYGGIEFSAVLRFTASREGNSTDKLGRSEIIVRDLYLDVDEAKEEAIDPEDGETILNVRLGLEEVRITAIADEIELCAGRPRLGDRPSWEQAEEEILDYRGDFFIHLRDNALPDWIVEAKVEGMVLKGRVEAETLAHLVLNREASAEIVISCDPKNVKVRLVPDEQLESQNSIQDEFRRRIKGALVHRELWGSQARYIVASKKMIEIEVN